MKKIGEVYRHAIDRLNEAEIENAAYDAKILFETVFGVKYANIIVSPDMEYDEKLAEILDKMLDRRIAGEPLQYIIGEWEFMGFTFKVGEGVLIPRPETEMLVEYTEKKLDGVYRPVVYDLCSGSGCIGLSVKKLLHSVRIFMVEKSDEALKYLNENRELLELTRDTAVIKGDIMLGYDGFSSLPKPDVILSNPPYIRSDELDTLQTEVKREPRVALDGGEDGLDFYRCLAEKWLPHINAGGYIAVECGEAQADDITSMFMPYCEQVEVLNDFANIRRIVIGTVANNLKEI